MEMLLLAGALLFAAVVIRIAQVSARHRRLHSDSRKAFDKIYGVGEHAPSLTVELDHHGRPGFGIRFSSSALLEEAEASGKNDALRSRLALVWVESRLGSRPLDAEHSILFWSPDDEERSRADTERQLAEHRAYDAKWNAYSQAEPSATANDCVTKLELLGYRVQVLSGTIWRVRGHGIDETAFGESQLLSLMNAHAGRAHERPGG